MAPPAFLGVGMPKCGTSTLHRVLAAHPDFFLPPIKEIKFFAYEQIGYAGGWQDLLFSRHWAARQDRQELGRRLRDVLYRRAAPSTLAWLGRYFFHKRDLDWYLSLFPEGRIGGDISPSYHTLSRHEIEAIGRLLPHLKIVVLLRSPLEQIWSHCRMVVLRLQGRDAVADFAAHVEETTEERRTYRGLVEDWKSQFGDRVLVGYQEDLAADPVASFGRIGAFLGVADTEAWLAGRPNIAKLRVNVGLAKAVPAELKSTLVEHAAIRLDGFETIDRSQAARWQRELDAFAMADTDLAVGWPISRTARQRP